MSALWLCTILLATLSCSARPNMPPSFLIGNAESPPTSRRIDLLKYLQDIQEVVSKAAKEASENAKQHVAAMNQKHMEMIRRQFLQSLAPISGIRKRLNAFNSQWNVRPSITPCPNCLPIKHNIASTYQPSYTIQTNLIPCLGNIFTCFHTIGLPSYRPTVIYSANRPCLDNMCKQTHTKPLVPEAVDSNDPFSKQTVISSLDGLSLEKTSLNNVLGFSKPNPHTSISSASLPVVSENTKPPLFQFTLPEKLFNLALDPTSPKTNESIETLEDLRKNSSILENEILEIKPVQSNKQLKDSSNLTSTDELAEHEITHAKFTTLGINELEIATSDSLVEIITTTKIAGSFNTLISLEEELKTESTNINVDQVRIGAFTISPSDKNLLTSQSTTDDIETPLPTIYISNKELTGQEQTTGQINGGHNTENIYELKSTGDPLLVSEKLVDNPKGFETTLEPFESTAYDKSAASSVQKYVDLRTDELSEKAFDEQVITSNPNLDELTTTAERIGAYINNEPKTKILEVTMYTTQNETAIQNDYNTSTLSTEIFIYETNNVTRELPETTSTESLFILTDKAISSELQKTTIIEEVTKQYEEVFTTEDVNDRNDIEFDLSKKFLDPVTKMNDESNQTPIDNIEEVTVSNEYFDNKSSLDLETTVVNIELTTEAAKNLISLNYEIKTENNTDLFETTTLNIFPDKGVAYEEKTHLNTTTDGADLSKVTDKESSNIFKVESHITTQEVGTGNYVAADNTLKTNILKTNVGNQTQPFDILSTNKTFRPETLTAATPEQLTTVAISDYTELITEGRSESYSGTTDHFETTTNYKRYLEISTKPYEKDFGEVDTTDVVLDYTTVFVNNEESFTSLFDLRRSGFSDNPINYQDGVLKFTTELDIETEASPTDDSSARSSISAALQKTLRKVRDKPSLRGRFSFSPVNSIKQCIGLLDCLISKTRTKRSSRDNIKTSSGKNMTALHGIHFPNLLNPTQLSKEKRSNAESSGLYGPALLELLPVVMEGYRNNAFNEDDKEVIKSIFGDLGSGAVDESVDNLKEVKGDLLMKDATARVEGLIEDDDYDSSDYGEVSLESPHRLKRSKKPYQLITSILKKTSNDKKKISNIKAPLQRYRRETRSSQSFSEAAAILALLAEQSDVQLDAPDDEEEDYYEYYEDEGSDNVALGDNFSKVDQEAYEDGDYEEPSFVELIKLARRHSQRKSRQES